MAAGVAVVLALLSLLHFYWTIVGVSGRSAALPEVDGRPVFQPTRLASFAVAVALAAAAWLILARGGLVPSPLPPSVVRTGAAGFGTAFLLRAVGDFRWVGFFKRVRGTRFAFWDTRLFSPLCMALGAASLWLALA
jgi:Na+-transporting methylmalonyl-CoA/oxaloacetate decarboxylase gamma subunit